MRWLFQATHKHTQNETKKLSENEKINFNQKENIWNATYKCKFIIFPIHISV